MVGERMAHLHCKGSATNKSDMRADLITKINMKILNYRLIGKYRPKGNSGIMYHVTEDYPTAYLSGPEYQLIDDNKFPGETEDWQKPAPTMPWILHPLLRHIHCRRMEPTKILVKRPC